MASHPIDREELLYHVFVIHAITGTCGQGYDNDLETALQEAKDDLLNRLEQAGGG